MKVLILWVIISNLVVLTYSQGADTGFFHPDQPVPDEFDAREKWPHCPSIGEIRIPIKCESTWPILMATVLRDRICIETNGTVDVEISTEDLLTCCTTCFSKNPHSSNRCQGIQNIEGFEEYMSTTGVVTGGWRSQTGCKPLSNGTINGTPPPCEHKCTNPNYTVPYEKDKVTIAAVRVQLLRKIKKVQIELLNYGPVVMSLALSIAAIKILSDKNFTEVYTGPDNKTPLNHGVKLIGWGTEKGVPYWLVATVWGPDWGGSQGFFRIQRGVNLLRCEDYLVAIETEYEDQDRDKKWDDVGNSAVKTSSVLVVTVLVVSCGHFTAVL